MCFLSLILVEHSDIVMDCILFYSVIPHARLYYSCKTHFVMVAIKSRMVS